MTATRNADTRADSGADWAATILRVSLGTLFIAHAGLKFFVFTPAGTWSYFEQLGMPGIVGYATIAGEFAIGAALILGIATRLAALAGVPIILGAIFMVHGANGFWAGKNGWEYLGFWTAALIAQALLGDGALALGRVFRAPRRTDQPAHA